MATEGYVHLYGLDIDDIVKLHTARILSTEEARKLLSIDKFYHEVVLKSR